jgi:hypothetical protein
VAIASREIAIGGGAAEGIAAACDPRRIMVCPDTRDAAAVHPNARCARRGCAQLFAIAAGPAEAAAIPLADAVAAIGDAIAEGLCLVVLIGTAGSGKSTLARQVLARQCTVELTTPEEGKMSSQADPFRRLDELTTIYNDFEDELSRQPTPGLGGGRRPQLDDDIRRVYDARGEEVGRLLQAGHTPEDLLEHVNATDRNRNR